MKDPNKVLFGITHILCVLDSSVLWFFFFETASKPGESRQQHNLKHLGKNFLESSIACKQTKKFNIKIDISVIIYRKHSNTF